MKKRTVIKTDLFAFDAHSKKIDTLGDPLVEIEAHIDFGALAEEVDRVGPRPLSSQGGRPPYPAETMVRILVLKRLYNLSDEQMEYQLLDRMSYKRFCGLANAANIPDRTTVWTFENRIGEAGGKVLFDGVTSQLLKHGFIARGGQIVDATWTQKHGKNHFGYKLSINVNAKYKVIRKFETGTASIHDSKHFDAMIDRANTSRDVYADWGYTSTDRERWIKGQGYRNQIQRKGRHNKPLSECQQRPNRRIAKTQARVEHVFATIDQMGGKLIRTIGQARANFAMTMMAACYNLKRLVYFQKAGIEAF